MNLSSTRLYSIWSNMKQRCYNKNNPKYSSYGEKGVTVCDEWKNKFLNFYTWAYKNGYEDPPKGYSHFQNCYYALTIDRIDSQKGYNPSNCRWITFEENRLHRTKNTMTKSLYENPPTPIEGKQAHKK